MSRFLRTMIGALVGAICVLLWNDVSRPYLIYLFSQVAAEPVVSQSIWITENRQVLAPPKTALDSSLWADAGAYKLRYAKAITANDMKNLLRAVRIGGELEPNNAFWPQMEAILYSASGRRRDATAKWISASKRPKWNDHQPERLHKVVEEIEKAVGHPSSWPLFALTAFRNDNASQLCLRFANSIIENTGFQKRSDLELRYATLVNGTLIRDFGSSISIHAAGADIMELASYPQNMDAYPTNKALILARIHFIDSLRDAGMTDEAEYANRQYQESDARNYYIGTSDPDGDLRQFALVSALIATAPSCLLGISILSSLLWAFGGLMLRYPSLQKSLTLPYAPLIGSIVAIGVYFAFHLWLLTIATVAVFAFATFGPTHERTNPSEDLGPFFRFSIIMIGVLLTAILGVFLMSLTEAAQVSNYVVEAPEEFVTGSIAMVVLGIACLSLLILIAPAWALVRKVRTSWVFAVGLRDLGKGMMLGAALVSVVSCVASVSLDRSLYAKGNALLEKEPLYYMATDG